MHSSQRRLRSFSPTLGQIMGAVAAVAGFMSLIATVRALSGESYQVYLIAGCVISYVVYLLFLVLISFEYFTRNQVLVLLAATGAFSALLIQGVAHSSGWLVLSSILALPMMPFVVGGLMLRHNQKTAELLEVEPGDSETLTTLVRNKRRRGLTPQETPPGETLTPEEIRAANRRRAIAIGLAVVLGAVAIELAHRRTALVRKSYELDKSASRCREEAALIGQSIENLEDQGPLSEANLRTIEEQRQRAAQWMREAAQHDRENRKLDGRWW